MTLLTTLIRHPNLGNIKLPDVDGMIVYTKRSPRWHLIELLPCPLSTMQDKNKDGAMRPLITESHRKFQHFSHLLLVTHTVCGKATIQDINTTRDEPPAATQQADYHKYHLQQHQETLNIVDKLVKCAKIHTMKKQNIVKIF